MNDGKLSSAQRHKGSLLGSYMISSRNYVGWLALRLMRVYVPRAFVSFLVLRTDNRTMIIDVLGTWISAVLTTVASRVQLASPDRSLCMEADYNEDGEEKLKPARRSRNPAKPVDPTFSEAKRASDDESDAATPASDEDENVKPARKGCKPKATAPARKYRAPAKKTPNHADVEAPLSTNLACMLKPQHLPRHLRKGKTDLPPMPAPSTLSTSRFVAYKMALVNVKLSRAKR